MTRPELATKMVEFLAAEFLEEAVPRYWRDRLHSMDLTDGEVEAAGALAAQTLLKAADRLAATPEEYP
jgi:hypothetical protein